MKKHFCCLLLALLLLGLTACKQNPTEAELFAKVLNHFESRGFACQLEKLTQTDRAVPIYNASVWHRLLADGEEVLVYFDESNRADYLSASIDREVYGQVACCGLRFILVYDGENPSVIQALAEMK